MPIKEVEKEYSYEHISGLSRDLNRSIKDALEHITSVNKQTRMLSFNAQIEAARAGGSAGAAFAVVAQAIQDLSDRTSGVTRQLREKTQGTIDEVSHLADVMADRMQGTRLADLALNNIDLIDRNLYERTCDVRWWATDSSLVDALSSMERKDLAFASKRLGVILSAYTVYYDLVLTDLEGRVVANGRPGQYHSVGRDVSKSEWFQTARKTSNGDEYGFEGCHPSDLVNGNRVLAYSCVVREGGDQNGRPLGVLGILFNWDELAQVIVEATPLPKEEWQRSRVCIVSEEGKILADTDGEQLRGDLGLDLDDILRSGITYSEMNYRGKPALVARASAPGYETYSTGWYSVIIQERIGKKETADEKREKAKAEEDQCEVLFGSLDALGSRL
ncbi:cache domain-containing protein [Pelagicoccus mobilis]|uniref:Cache domain-containing protein n=1 Tax=Pelagicoccus mobilis TaxID=415221 RepID=A0A934S780_9BACT|nr:cache domain-containing protein [Pelagicoccus mobilis]MBK1880629.1 cache domain-containing protein [Pelagicoccus mobilis]